MSDLRFQRFDRRLGRRRRSRTFSRVAAFGSGICIDLCDERWRQLQIQKDAWSIVEAEESPVIFRRSKAMLPLPDPAARADFGMLRKFLNADKDGFALIAAFLVNAARPGYPYPILILTGEQGTAKSTAARVLRELVDPNSAPLRSAPRTDQDLLIAATNSWMCSFDNLSHVPDWLSDALCRLSTFGAFATRKLYANDEEIVLTAKRPVILNGIGDIAHRSDLLDRALIVRLEPINVGQRRTESEFWGEFERAKPEIFAGLMQAVSSALANINEVDLPVDLPRMADFAAWAVAAEGGLGFEPGTVLRAYRANRTNVHSMAVEGSRLAEVLLKHYDERAGASGTFSETILNKRLFATLKSFQDSVDPSLSMDKTLPKTPKGLRTALERLSPNLRECGLRIRFLGHSREGAKLEVEYTREQPSHPSHPSHVCKSEAAGGDGSVNDCLRRNAKRHALQNRSKLDKTGQKQDR